MIQKSVSYKHMKTDGFREFIHLLQVDCKMLMETPQGKLPDKAQKNLNQVLNKCFDGIFSYYALQESIHNVFQKMLREGHHLQDTSLINELSRYNAQVTDRKEFQQRIKMDLVLLLILRGPSYYMAAWNDCESVNGAFHAEAYRHIGKGIVAGIKSRSFSKGVDVAWVSKWKERYRRRAAAIRDIDLLMSLYLYSCYLSCGDIRCISEAVQWIVAAGYKWLYVPDDLKYDILNCFLVMDVPEVGFGIPAEMIMLDCYANIEMYKNSILLQYPGCPEVLRNFITGATNLPKKFNAFLNVPE